MEDRSLEMVYWRGILNFSSDRFQDIARQAVHRMQRIDASGIFGDDYHHKTLWDEFCHEVQTGPTPIVDQAMDRTVRPLIDSLVEALPRHEVALLSLSNSQYDHYDSEEPVQDADYVADEILKQLSEIAGDRDLSRFDPMT